MLLLIVPGIAKTAKLFVALPAAFLGSRDPLVESQGMVKGSGWEIFALGSAPFTPLVLAVRIEVLLKGPSVASIRSRACAP